MSEDIKNKDVQAGDDDMMVDVVTFVDDENNEFEMEIVEEFEHKGLKYAVLAELNGEDHAVHSHEHGEHCDHDHSHEEESLFIFEVTTKDGEEEFIPIDDDDLLDELTVIVEAKLQEQEEQEKQK